MKQIPRIFYRATTQIWYYVMLPLFFLAFVLLYQPRFMADFFTTSRDLLHFNTTMLACILLGVMAITRNLLFILRKHLHLNWLYYTAWCVMEMVASASFMGLYMTLITRGSIAYFPALGYCLGFLLMVLVYPYIILTFVVAARDPERKEANTPLIRFHDNTGRLKCVVAAPALLYIEADINNVHIRYLDGDKIKDYSLRNSMRALEELMGKHGMIRCQRSFYINPAHVKALRREKEGVIVAELDIPSTRAIPVSPKYYDNLAKLL